MAKTYTAAGSATAGDVYTASAHNIIVTDVNNFIVPPMARVQRTTNFTATSGTAITWSSADFDTDGMFAAGSPTLLTVTTAGIYVVNFSGYLSAATTLTNPVGLIAINGTAQLQQYMTQIGPNAIFTISGIMKLAANDTVTAYGSFAGTGPFSFAGSTTDSQQTRLTIAWIGRTS